MIQKIPLDIFLTLDCVSIHWGRATAAVFLNNIILFCFIIIIIINIIIIPFTRMAVVKQSFLSLCLSLTHELIHKHTHSHANVFPDFEFDTFCALDWLSAWFILSSIKVMTHSWFSIVWTYSSYIIIIIHKITVLYFWICLLSANGCSILMLSS